VQDPTGSDFFPRGAHRFERISYPGTHAQDTSSGNFTLLPSPADPALTEKETRRQLKLRSKETTEKDKAVKKTGKQDTEKK